MIRLGIIGVGGTVSIADLHVKAIQTDHDFVITKIYNRTFEKGNDFIKKHQLNAKNCETLTEFFEDIDAVIITTSNDTHDYFMKEASKHHIHILVEKPLTGVCESSSALYEELKSYKQTIMIGFLNRYASIIRDVKQIIKNDFTSIFSVQGSFGGKRIANPSVPFEWRMSQKSSLYGASIDFGSHLIDLVSYILDQPLSMNYQSLSTPIHFRDDKGKLRSVENDDLSAMILRADETIVSLMVSRIGLNGINLLISGDGGILHISYENPMKLTYEKKEIKGGYTGEIIEKYYHETQLELMISQLKTFKRAMTDDKTVYPHLKEAMLIDCLIDTKN